VLSESFSVLLWLTLHAKQALNGESGLYRRNKPDSPFKTCAKCREKAMVRTNRLRTRAAAAGERRCSSGHHQVSVAACTNPDGEVMASCVDCRQRRHNARTAAAVEAEDLAPDVDDALLGPAEGIEDGLAVDNEFGDAQWMMDDGRTELLQSS
jgi:hypothetical protein